MITDNEITKFLDDVEKNRHEINKVDLEEIKFSLWELKNVDKKLFLKNIIIAYVVFAVLSLLLPILFFFDFLENQSVDFKSSVLGGSMFVLFLLVFSQFKFNKKLIAKIKRELSEKKEEIKSKIVLNGGNVSIAEYVMSLGSPIDNEGIRFQAFYLLSKEEYSGKFLDLESTDILDKEEMSMELARANALFNKAKDIIKP